MTVDESLPLAAFEDLALSQCGAGAPWTPVLPYDIETRRAVEGKQPKIIKDAFRCGPDDRVLDYGCGAGYLVAFLAELGCNISGYEPSPALRDHVPPYVRSRVSTSYWHNDMNINRAVYHLVICREVLEHLTILKVRETVRDLCLIAKNFVYVTTRFAQEPASLLSVETSDDLDPTHITMLNKNLLRLLFVLEGFRRRADLEEQLDWQHKGRVLVYERAV
jgi:SAM-dependent methyltransferase